jgi:hypothetical protein
LLSRDFRKHQEVERTSGHKIAGCIEHLAGYLSIAMMNSSTTPTIKNTIGIKYSMAPVTRNFSGA